MKQKLYAFHFVESNGLSKNVFFSVNKPEEGRTYIVDICEVEIPDHIYLDETMRSALYQEHLQQEQDKKVQEAKEYLAKHT